MPALRLWLLRVAVTLEMTGLWAASILMAAVVSRLSDKLEFCPGGSINSKFSKKNLDTRVTVLEWKLFT